MSKQSFPKDKQHYLLSGFPNSNLICAFSSRHLKNMSLLYGDKKESLNNRRIFLASLEIDYQNLICAKQIHGSCVRYVQEEDRGRGALSYNSSIADTDALVTDKKNLPLAIFTADCLSIFLYDPLRPAIGIIHASWRSTQENIVSKTIQLMRKEFSTEPKNLYVGFGPAIRDCCYEVGEEFVGYFRFGLIKINGRYYLDLIRINKKKFLDLGVCDINIYDSKICTSCENREFFSYRKEGNSCGRMISVMMLR